MKLGIVHERIQAGRPQQNGRHERMHRTLKGGHDETACGIPSRTAEPLR
jgi:transposase InsO family protein